MFLLGTAYFVAGSYPAEYSILKHLTSAGVRREEDEDIAGLKSVSATSDLKV